MAFIWALKNMNPSTEQKKNDFYRLKMGRLFDSFLFLLFDDNKMKKYKFKIVLSVRLKRNY